MKTVFGRRSAVGAILTATLAFPLANPAAAQQENSLSTQVELGGIFTTGNTEDENAKYKGTVTWDRGNLAYRVQSEGLRSSKNDEPASQRLYHVGSINYTLSPDSFVLTRAAYEDDRFSGYESQSDFSVSYGRNFLSGMNEMTLSAELGAGVRHSETETDQFDEVILRLASDYEWGISDTATFIQHLTAEAGGETSIYRSESAIETQIVENWLLKFSFNVKHQTDVPPDREKTDTITAVTLVLNF